jgi:hypothetical protein
MDTSTVFISSQTLLLTIDMISAYRYTDTSKLKKVKLKPSLNRSRYARGFQEVETPRALRQSVYGSYTPIAIV